MIPRLSGIVALLEDTHDSGRFTHTRKRIGVPRGYGLQLEPLRPFSRRAPGMPIALPALMATVAAPQFPWRARLLTTSGALRFASLVQSCFCTASPQRSKFDLALAMLPDLAA